MVPAPPMTLMAWLRWDAIRSALDRVAPSTILEVGAGQGAVGARLAARASYTGVEPDPTSASVAGQRIGERGTLLQGSVDAVDDDLRVDLVCSFEVLEHIEDDVGALRAWRRHLRDGGMLLISVPAHPERFGAADRLVGHHRRYRRDGLTEVLERAGFHVVEITSYGAGMGHLLEAVRNRLIERRDLNPSSVGTEGSGRFRQPPAWSGALTWLAALPGRAVQRLARGRIDGVGWVALARTSDELGDEI